MPSSRIPSPARSQGVKSTPRQYKQRASRSVGSPAHSTTSVKLTALMQMNSFALSPMPTRRSVLMNTTDVEIPTGKGWWKKLDENSREIMEVFNNKDLAVGNNAIEEYIEIDVLSQERKNYSIDIPESSDGESITSIVIPQKKLFTQKERKSQKHFVQIIDNRESLATLHQSQRDSDKTINVGRKNLFSQGTKQRTKPLFPSALLNISANKTIANKTKEMVANDPKVEVKSLFGNKPGMKRKNIFADFIVSDSEDEIPEIQTKVFDFQKKVEQNRRLSKTRAGRESRLTSPTSSITDIEIDDWRHLPSSTMVDQELEEGLRITPHKKAKLFKLTEDTEVVSTENNTTANKTKQSNKSLTSKSKSKNASQCNEMESNELIGSAVNTSRLVKEKNISNNDEVYVSVGKNVESNRKTSNTMSKIDQIFQSDDDEEFNLVYENDDIDELENEQSGAKLNSNVEGTKETSDINKTLNRSKQVQNKSKSQNIVHQVSQMNEENTEKRPINQTINSSRNNLNNTNENRGKASEFENNVDQILSEQQNRTKCTKLDDCEKEEILKADNKLNKTEHDLRQKSNNSNIQITNIEVDDADNNICDNRENPIKNDEEKKSKIKAKKKDAKLINRTTVGHEQKDDAKVASPEVILYNKTTQMESFTEQGRNNSVRKTKSIIKNHTIRPSFAPARGSTGLGNISDGSKNSSAERSGWDSHRTTRATLRQTFGKDFTPRKSLRALVMEKSAKRRTNFTENNAEISRLPQANSTELPLSATAINQSNIEMSNNNFNDDLHNSDDTKTFNKSDRQVSQNVNEWDEAKKMPNLFPSENDVENNDLDQEQWVNEFDTEPVKNKSGEAQLYSENNDSAQEQKVDAEHESNESHEAQVYNENTDSAQDQEADERDSEHENNDSDQEQLFNECVPENNEFDEVQKYVESDAEYENNESDEGQKYNESIDSDPEQEFNDSIAQHGNNESGAAQEYNENVDSDQEQEFSVLDEEETKESDEAENNESDNFKDSDQEIINEINISEEEINDHDEAHEIDESEHEITAGMDESGNAEEMNDPEDSQEMNQSDHEVSRNIDNDEESITEDVEEMDESNNQQTMNESDEEVHPEGTNLVHADHAPSLNEDQELDEMEQDHEEPRKTRQTTLEMYLEKVKKRNVERNKQLEEEIRKSIKPPTKDMINPFKVPAVPKLRRMKIQQTKIKAKSIKPSIIPLDMLPDELVQDMKYKPPKRYRPPNASWITKRLYKFLETKLEPKYDYKARIRSEKLVETIYNFTKDIRRHETAPREAVHELKHEMARLGIVNTHFEFYEFFHEFMPREVRIKVVPDVFNKISLPKYGVFSDILRSK